MELTNTVTWKLLGEGVEINAQAWTPAAQRLLTPRAVALLARLHRRLNPERLRLLTARTDRQAAYDAGKRPSFLPKGEHPATETDWQIAPLPSDLHQRRVEITGPVSDAKMVINMLSRTANGHRADCAMLDFEDAMKPSWANVMQGVANVREAVAGTLEHVKFAPDGSVAKVYRLDPDDLPVIMVRVRGLHLEESNLRVDGTPLPGTLLDFGLSALYTAREQVAQGRTPKFYVPKVEHYEEARWYDTLMTLLEEELELDHGTLKATFLIETLPAAFQMEEILYEFRDHAAGLNGGRWDKIFSDIKTFRTHPDRVLADRGTIGMNRPWMADYAKQLIRVCHRHGALAMGGMAAFTPGRSPQRRAEQTAKVVADKEFEAGIGHDGCWVSHPYFIGPAMEPFNKRLTATGRPNQLAVLPDLPRHPDLLPVGGGPRTMAGLRKNVRVGIAYLKGWNEDLGCVAWDDLMEDLATLEISRAQTWQWCHHGVELDDGSRVTQTLIRQVFAEELGRIKAELRDNMAGAPPTKLAQQLARYTRAATEAAALFTEPTMRSFLTNRSDLVGLSAEPSATPA